MSFVKANRVQEVSTTIGTGDVVLGGAYDASYRTFSSQMSNGDTCQVLIINDDAISEWEIDEATFSVAAGPIYSIQRTSVLSSSNSNNLVNFSSGTKRVAMLPPASAMVVEDNLGNASVTGSFTVGNEILVGASPSAGVSGQFLISGGPGQPPSWGEGILPDLGTSAVAVSISSSGDNTILSGTVGTSIKVYRMLLVAASPVTVQIKSASTALSGPQSITNMILDASATPYYSCGVNEALIISLGSAVQVGGTIWYKRE